MAKKFQLEYQWPIPTYVDSFDNQFNHYYASWPDRAYLIFGGEMIYVARINSDGSRNTTWTQEIESLFQSL
jgi:hypothetical protein